MNKNAVSEYGDPQRVEFKVYFQRGPTVWQSSFYLMSTHKWGNFCAVGLRFWAIEVSRANGKIALLLLLRDLDQLAKCWMCRLVGWKVVSSSGCGRLLVVEARPLRPHLTETDPAGASGVSSAPSWHFSRTFVIPTLSFPIWSLLALNLQTQLPFFSLVCPPPCFCLFLIISVTLEFQSPPTPPPGFSCSVFHLLFRCIRIDLRFPQLWFRCLFLLPPPVFFHLLNRCTAVFCCPAATKNKPSYRLSVTKKKLHCVPVTDAHVRVHPKERPSSRSPFSPNSLQRASYGFRRPTSRRRTWRTAASASTAPFLPRPARTPSMLCCGMWDTRPGQRQTSSCCGLNARGPLSTAPTRTRRGCGAECSPRGCRRDSTCWRWTGQRPAILAPTTAWWKNGLVTQMEPGIESPATPRGSRRF